MGEKPVKQKSNRKLPSTAFKKGQSGNPHGRPRVGNTIAEAIRAMLEPTGKRDEIIERAIKGALSDDKDACSWATFLFDRAYGKPAQPITGEGGGPIEILYVNTFTGV